MMRRQVGACALAGILVALVVPAGAGDPLRSQPMQFALRQEGPIASCKDKCRRWISAIGMIKPDTPREFAGFAAKSDIRGATIALDSEGGSVLGAMALGRLIRRLDMTTTIGKTSELPGKDGRATLSPRADCESMCAFVLLAGTQRVVPPEARVRVHQIWLGDRRDDAAAATYSAEDLVLVQRDIGRLVEYTNEMGGTGALLELSLRIPPWEPMRILTRDELRRMRLDTSEAAPERQTAAPETVSTAALERPMPAAAAAATASAPAVNSAATSIHRMSPGSERGWIMIEQSGASMLARHHPLTVEGETIGSFDVMFGCGPSPNEYAVRYGETRKGAGAQKTPAAINSVAISMGFRTSPLAVGRSELDAAGGERDSSASGMVSAAMLKSFAEPGNRSLTIATSVAGHATTSIRVGNSGVAQYLTRLAASCAQQARTEHAGLVQPK